MRLQRLVSSVRAHFSCGAVALLQLEEDHLRPVAVDGLTQDALGRRFAVQQHPRLAAILARRGVTCFHHDSTLPDPYDGLINGMAGEPLPVHDCMGTSLHVEGQPWGVLTLDALEVGTFGAEAQSELRELIMLVEAALRTTRLEAETRALRLTRASPGRRRARRQPRDPGPERAHRPPAARDRRGVGLGTAHPAAGRDRRGQGTVRAPRAPAVATPRQAAGARELRRPARVAGRERAVRPRQGRVLGAVADRPGRFEAANGGTLFLDEVGELPLLVQAKLLRALQNGEIQRLGDDRPRRVDVRIVAATNRSLKDLVRDGDFRADLYHRLSVYPIAIPPLRERRAAAGRPLPGTACWPAPKRRCAATAGRAMCASWSMSSAAPPSRR